MRNSSTIVGDISHGTVSASLACDQSLNYSVGGKQKSHFDEPASELSSHIVQGYCGENNDEMPISTAGKYQCPCTIIPV